MSKTEVSGKQVKDGSIELVDLSTALSNTISGKAESADVTALDTRVTAVESDVAALQSASAPNLSDLGEVSITSPSSGQVLKYNGTGWANAADSTFSGDYADLSNKPTIPSALDDLSDVTISSPSNDQVLKYNGTAWVNSAAPAAGATDLDGLSDVAVTSAAKGQFIVHNGTSFVNSNTIEASGAAVKPLIVKGAASQSANLFEVQNSSSQILSRIASDGSLVMNDSAGANGYTISNSTGNERHALAGQKAFQITQPGVYGTTTTFSIGADDTVGENGKWQIRYGFNGSSGSAVNFRPGYQDANRFGGVGIMVPDDMYVKARLHIHNVPFPTQNNYGDFTGLLIQNYDNQSNTNAFEIQSHTNVKQFAINKQGQVQAVSASTKALVVKGAASQTANLFEVQNSSSTVLTSVASDGSLNASRFVETAANAFSTSLAPSSGTLTVDSSVGNVVLGALSASVTTWAFTNVPTTNSRVTTVSAVIAGNTSYTYGSSCSVNGNAVATGVQWFGGTAPTPSSTTDVLTFAIVRDSAGTIRVLGSAQTIDSVIGSASAGIDGAGSANYLSKWTDANTIANSAIYESAGNVGIGTASPASKVHLNATGDIKLTIQSTGGAAYDQSIHFKDTASDWLIGNKWSSDANGFGIGRTASKDDFCIDSNGAVLVGVGAASVTTHKFEVKGSALFRGVGNSTLRSNSGCAAYIAYQGVGNEYGLSFRNVVDNSTAVEFVNAANTAVGSITQGSSSVSFNTTSDYRLKTNVTPMSNALSRVSLLKPCTFDWISTNQPSEGFIAHELAEVVPEAVNGQKDAVRESDGSPLYQGVDYGKLTPLLAAALKELSAKVDALQAEKEALEARIAALENK